MATASSRTIAPRRGTAFSAATRSWNPSPSRKAARPRRKRTQLRHAPPEGLTARRSACMRPPKNSDCRPQFIGPTRRLPRHRLRGRHVSEAIRSTSAKWHVANAHICVIVERRRSGGAIGIGVTELRADFENSYYSVISHEGCAAIIWKIQPPRQAAEASAQRRHPRKNGMT